MGRKRKSKPAPPLSAEEQRRSLGHKPGPHVALELTTIGDYLEDVSGAKLGWHDKRKALDAEIRAKAAKSIVDPGKDASGHFDVSPYAARGHKIERAPQELRKSPDSQFPKRIATQRMIDRYKAQKLITVTEWRGGEGLWQTYCGLELAARLTSNYDPDVIGGTFMPDSVMLKKLESVETYMVIMRRIPYRSRGVVNAVVILDWSASQWARGRGYAGRDSERHGLERLRPGLQALADFWGY